jgi:hypothetical protein
MKMSQVRAISNPTVTANPASAVPRSTALQDAGSTTTEKFRARSTKSGGPQPPSDPSSPGRPTAWLTWSGGAELGEAIEDAAGTGDRRNRQLGAPVPVGAVPGPWWAGPLGLSLVGWALGYAAAHLDHPAAPPLIACRRKLQHSCT